MIAASSTYRPVPVFHAMSQRWSGYVGAGFLSIDHRLWKKLILVAA